MLTGNRGREAACAAKLPKPDCVFRFGGGVPEVPLLVGEGERRAAGAWGGDRQESGEKECRFATIDNGLCLSLRSYREE